MSSRLPSAYAGTPELAGPGQETESGAIVFGEQMTPPRIGRPPSPTAEERAAAMELPNRCVNCGGDIPADLLQALSKVAQRAGYPHSGCFWHGHTPGVLLTQLQHLAGHKAGDQQ